MTKTNQVTVLVDNLAFGGSGIGKVIESPPEKKEWNGIKAFVPFTIPGENVLADVLEEKPQYLKTKLCRVLNSSPERVSPPCPYFTNCGGCVLQHISYKEQLSLKLEILKGALLSAGLGENLKQVIEPVWGEKAFNYRQRLSLHLDEKGKIGLYQALSRAVVPVKSCLITINTISNCLAEIEQLGSILKEKISTILLEADEKKLICLLKASHTISVKQEEKIFEESLTLFPNLVLVVKGEERKKRGETNLEIILDTQSGLTLKVPAGSFSQVNNQVNQKIVSEIEKEALKIKAQAVLDLYAGAGNFSLLLAKKGGDVVAVETDQSLVKMGQENIKSHALEKNFKFVNSSVEQFLKKDRKKQYDLVILDPPRSGTEKIVADLPSAKKLILISCHLPSLVKDLKALIRYGWNVKAIKPYDMFAQTSYLEVVTILEK